MLWVRCSGNSWDWAEMAIGGTRSTGKRLAISGALVLIAIPALPSRPAQARSEVTPPPLVGHYQRLEAGRLVDIRQLGQRSASAPTAVPAHRVLRHAKSYPALKTPAIRAAQPLVLQGSVEEQLTVFPGIDLATGKAALPNQNTEPPDTQIAAGPDQVVELVNSNMTTWTKTGTRLTITDLNAFYAVSPGFSITDPRVLYDAPSGRFIATAFALDASLDSRVYLAVSQTSDPGGVWTWWQIRSTIKTVTDQPKVGVSDDKVTVSWAEGVPPPCGNPIQTVYVCFTGEVTFVVQKSDVLAVPAGVPHTFVLGPDQARFGLLPVQSVSPTTTQYLVYNNADPYWTEENQCGTPPTNTLYWNCPTLGILAITGTPAAGNIHAVESDPAIASTLAPPDAEQLGGTPTTMLVSTGDDRLVSAVYQNNRIWTSATDGNFCSTANPNTTPPGSCLLMLEAATDQAGFPVVQSWVVGGTGDFAYYPALGLDAAGNPLVAFSRSNSGLYPGAYVTGQPGFGNQWTAWAAIAAGAGKYDTSTSCGGHDRWGDYSGAATDPTDPTDVWVAAEYAPSNVNSCLWATSIARLTYSQPTVTSVTPQTGSAGISVVVTGTDFLSGNTIVYFGANAASAVGVQTPNHLTATAPSGSGLVSLSAATADGHGPNGVQFKYPRVESGAPLVAPLAGGVVRGNAPPSVPPSTAGPRPLVPANSSGSQPTPSPSGGVQGGGLTPQLWLSIQLAVLRFFAFVLSP